MTYELAGTATEPGQQRLDMLAVSTWSSRQLEGFLFPYLHERRVSGPMHLGEGTQEVARQAVRDAFATFGKRGLILSAVHSIRAHWPWENALATFDEWRRLRAFR